MSSGFGKFAMSIVIVRVFIVEGSLLDVWLI